MAGDTWCTHGLHHSYCQDCLEGPQPMEPQVATVRRGARYSPTREVMARAGEAVSAAMLMAPEVAVAARSDSTDRAVDIVFPAANQAEYARDKINESLASSEWAGLVSAWVWRLETSTGTALTPAGDSTGIELRLQTRFTEREARQRSADAAADAVAPAI